MIVAGQPAALRGTSVPPEDKEAAAVMGNEVATGAAPGGRVTSAVAPAPAARQL